MLHSALASFTLSLLPLFGSQSTGDEPEALVTFYSSGRFFMGMPGSKAAFKGKLFDDDHQLALLQPNRFVTFAFEPGSHILSANWWMTSGPGGGTRINMRLLPDHHYYLSAEFQEVGLGGTEISMHEISCEDAQAVAARVKVLEPKHLHHDGQVSVVSEKSFPPCPKE